MTHLVYLRKSSIVVSLLQALAKGTAGADTSLALSGGRKPALWRPLGRQKRLLTGHFYPIQFNPIQSNVMGIFRGMCFEVFK